jgi:predicted alternative tryptophan synthase beta-subunit
MIMISFPRFAPCEARYLPESFYNIKADLPELPPPALHPGTRQPLSAEDWASVFSRGFIEHEMSLDRFVRIPDDVRRAYSLFRLTPLVFMHTLGKDFVPPSIHAGGLRYHGMAPLVSHLTATGIVEPKAVASEKVFEAARFFYKEEGILPAPESAHAVAAAIDEALEAKRRRQAEVILFNLSGHGFLDLNAYVSSGNGTHRL